MKEFVLYSSSEKPHSINKEEFEPLLKLKEHYPFRRIKAFEDYERREDNSSDKILEEWWPMPNKHGAVTIVGETFGDIIFKDNFTVLKNILVPSNNYYVLYENQSTSKFNLLIIGMEQNHHLYVEKFRYLLAENIENDIHTDAELLAENIEHLLRENFPFLNICSPDIHDYNLWNLCYV